MDPEQKKWAQIAKPSRQRGSKWKATEKKRFRDVFATPAKMSRMKTIEL